MLILKCQLWEELILKRKKTVVAKDVNTVPKEQELSREAQTVEGRSAWDTGMIVLLSVLLFLSMTLQTGSMSVILTAAALLLLIGKQPLQTLRQRFGLPVVGMLAFAVMMGLAAIYSDFGSYAVREFPKFLAAFAVFTMVISRVRREHLRGLLWGFAIICGVISLLCVDAASTSVLYNGFAACMKALGGSYGDVVQDISSNRVMGIFNDANVSASILAFGSFVSLYLVRTGETRRTRLGASVLLGMSAMGFFLSLSRGAILCFGLALLVWLAAEGKGNRLALVFLMAISAVVTLAFSMLAMPGLSAKNILPDFLTVAAGLVIFALNEGITARLTRLLEGRDKAVVAVVVGLAVLCVGYGTAAVLVTGSYTFDESGYVARTIELEPGTYTISGDWDGAPQVNVLAQSKLDMLRRTGGGTSLYSGSLEDASFTVAGDEFRLSLLIWGESGETLRSITFSDGTEVALGHPLLPSFVANRLQDDLLTSNSFLQRVQFLKDGWTLFLQSPLIGHGLGSTEGLLTSVQPYYYESLYLHCHILQVMEETGLLGLVFFLMLMLGVLARLVKRLRQGIDPMAGMLLACWVLMNTHSLMEINFSLRPYLCAALFLLAVSVVACTEPKEETKGRWKGVASLALFACYLLVFGGLYESHRMVERQMETFSTQDVGEFMDTCQKFVRMDVFDHEQNQLNYVGNAVLLDSSRYNGPMRKYAEALRESGTYTACSGLAEYYYLPKGEWEEVFACSREAIAQEASAQDAWNQQFDFYRNEVLAAIGPEDISVFIDGVLETRDYLEAYSQGRWEEIELTEENTAFLNSVDSVREKNLPDEAAYQLLTQMYVPAETPEG